MNDCTESPNSKGASIAPKTTMQGKHDELAQRVSYLDKFEKDLYDINDRLAQVANAINPEDYFDNFKDNGIASGPVEEEKQPRRYQDGLVGTMDTHIGQLNNRINILQSGISLALRNIRYIQEQI